MRRAAVAATWAFLHRVISLYREGGGVDTGAVTTLRAVRKAGGGGPRGLG